MKFALFGNTYRNQNSCYADVLLQALRNYQAQICISHDFYQFLQESITCDLTDTETFEEDNFMADMVISIGGDGTFLRAAGAVGNKNIPILGINTGRLGFLADIAPEDITTTIDDIYQGRYKVELRTVLKLESESNSLKYSPYGLNEIAVLKRDSSSMITIHTSINGAYLTTYEADGLIISTPTGSTAYSLSVGGPVIVPHSNTIAITPVAPHSLNIRPIVICDDWEITLDVESRNHNFLIAIDGRNETLSQGSRLTVKKADYTTKVVKRYNHVFFNTLRNKMNWGIDNRSTENPSSDTCM
ncbi:MAG: NAD kinase [Bacteroides sp.]|nr:NAD kinase [Bacteroides sp.]